MNVYYDDMSSSRRRNGKPASCEPCRRDKVRCDHKLPICTRCQQRRIINRCFYHPAPLTRRRILSPTPAAEARPRSSMLVETLSTPSSSEKRFSNPEVTSPLPLGYLGPTSFAAEFGAHSGSPDGFSSTDSSITGVASSNRLQPYWFGKISEVLNLLEDFSFIERLVSDFYNSSPAPMIPAPFVRNSFSSIHKLAKEYLPKKVMRLASGMIDNTMKIFQIPASTQGCDFHELYTGVNFRLEILGIIFAQAGRSTQFGTGSGAYSICGEPQTRTQFAQRMYLASDIILQICKMLTPTNDLLLWLVYEKIALSDLIHGASSETLWGQLGDLSTRIFSLGVHREPKDVSGMPEFLVQMRKRFYAASYRIDKNIATFLGRPPRLSSRHSDCSLPLCIDDNIFNASNDVLRQAMQDTDEVGWSVQADPAFYPTAWIRIQCSTAMFREEILDISMMTPGPRTAQQLNDISRRCKENWQSHPTYLHFTPNILNENENDNVFIAFMRILSYIAHLYNEFLIQRLLVRQHHALNTSLLLVSSEILSTVLFVGRFCGHMRNIYVDFTSSIRLYGFPAASVLIEALQTETRSGVFFDFPTPRSEIIRNLSVFISHIDMDSVERPRNGSDALFKRASRFFTSVIDEVIGSKLIATGNGIPSSNTDDSTAIWNQDDAMTFIGDGIQLEDMDFGIMFDQWLI